MKQPTAGRGPRPWSVAALLFGLLASCASPTATPASSPATPDPTYQAEILALRDPDVPELPFPDNPDPSLCGVPVRWGSEASAWLSGYYEGELVEPVVHLYDSHLRLKITGTAPHGTGVQVLLYQENPVTDYYLVKIMEGANAGVEGWIPEHFITFEEGWQ